MSKKDNITPKHPVPELSQDYNYTKCSSSTDCTGVVPTPPQTSAELDSYLDTYDFLPHSTLTQPNDVEIDLLVAENQKNNVKKSPH